MHTKAPPWLFTTNSMPQKGQPAHLPSRHPRKQWSTSRRPAVFDVVLWSLVDLQRQMVYGEQLIIVYSSDCCIKVNVQCWPLTVLFVFLHSQMFQIIGQILVSGKDNPNKTKSSFQTVILCISGQISLSLSEKVILPKPNNWLCHPHYNQSLASP